MIYKIALCLNCHCMTKGIEREDGSVFCGKCQAFKKEKEART